MSVSLLRVSGCLVWSLHYDKDNECGVTLDAGKLANFRGPLPNERHASGRPVGMHPKSGGRRISFWMCRLVVMSAVGYESCLMPMASGNSDPISGPWAASASVDATNPSGPGTDADLLARIGRRDSAALGEFYDRHVGTLFGLAYRILNDHKEAEDLVQEVLLLIWEKGANFNPAEGRPLAWVVVLTRNKAIDRLRSAQRRARLAEQIENELGGNDTAHAACAGANIGDDEAQLIRRALTQLPEDQRRAIHLAFFDGLSQSEIATELDEALGTIKARIRRGMQRLREELGPQLCLSPNEKTPAQDGNS